MGGATDRKAATFRLQDPGWNTFSRSNMRRFLSSGEPNNPISPSYPALENLSFSISKELVSPILVHLRCKASTQLIIGKARKQRALTRNLEPGWQQIRSFTPSNGIVWMTLYTLFACRYEHSRVYNASPVSSMSKFTNKSPPTSVSIVHVLLLRHRTLQLPRLKRRSNISNIPQLHLGLRLNGPSPHMRQQGHMRIIHQPWMHFRLFFIDVQTTRIDFAGIERFHESSFVDDGAAGRVDNHYALFH